MERPCPRCQYFEPRASRKLFSCRNCGNIGCLDRGGYQESGCFNANRMQEDASCKACGEQWPTLMEYL